MADKNEERAMEIKKALDDAILGFNTDPNYKKSTEWQFKKQRLSTLMKQDGGCGCGDRAVYLDRMFKQIESGNFKGTIPLMGLIYQSSLHSLKKLVFPYL